MHKVAIGGLEMSNMTKGLQKWNPKNKFMVFKQSSPEDKRRAVKEFFINNLLYILLFYDIVLPELNELQYRHLQLHLNLYHHLQEH